MSHFVDTETIFVVLNIINILTKDNISCKVTPIQAANASQPHYNTIAGVQANIRVSYPIRVITRVKCIDI